MTAIFQITCKGHDDLYREGVAVGESYRSRIAGLRFIRYRRINITIVEGKSSIEISIRDAGPGVCEITCPMDIAHYLTLAAGERRARLYETVFLIMEKLAETKHWNQAVFQKIAESIRSAGYILPINYFKPALSPALTKIVGLDQVYTFEYAEFILNVYNREGGLLKTMPVFQCDVSSMLFSRFFTFKEWVTDDLLVIKDANREIHFVCDLISGEVVIELHPDVNTEQELMALLKRLHYAASGAERMRLSHIAGAGSSKNNTE